MNPKEKEQKRKRRHKRTKAKIQGTEEVPRLSIYRSNKHTYAQLINDRKGETLTQANDRQLEEAEIETDRSKFEEKFREPDQAQKTFQAYQVGKLLAQRATKNEITEVRFDRSGYKYHGRVKALAEAAREEGLKL